MELEISRLDHYGVVAGVIKDLKLVEQIDSLLGKHEQSEISHGEAIAGMILLFVGLIPVIMWIRCDLGWMIRLWIDNQFFLVG